MRYPMNLLCKNCGRDWGKHNGMKCPVPSTGFVPVDPPVVGPQLAGSPAPLKGTSIVPTLSVTSDKVKAAAAQCPDAARVLKTLFPEAFVDPRYDSAGRVMVKVGRTWQGGTLYQGNSLTNAIYAADGTVYVEVRQGSNFANAGLLLGGAYDWAIERDAQGYNVLVATKKG